MGGTSCQRSRPQFFIALDQVFVFATGVFLLALIDF
jgi:hypothetical protein